MVCSVRLLFAVAVDVVGRIDSSRIEDRLETEQLALMVVVPFESLVVMIQNKSSRV